jgi:hypothetical protein
MAGSAGVMTAGATGAGTFCKVEHLVLVQPGPMHMTSEPTPPRRPQNFNDVSFNDNLAKDATRPIAESEDLWVADFIARLAGALEGINLKK